MKSLFTFLLMGLLMNPVVGYAADLTLNATIANAINTTYEPPIDFPSSMPGRLNLTTELQAPATVDTTGLSGQSIFQVLAPANTRISVTPVTQESGTSVYIWLSYLGSANIGNITLGAPTITYTGLEGTAPSFFNDSVVHWSGTESQLRLRFNAMNVSNFSFTSITFTQAITGTANPTTQNIQTYNFIVEDNEYSGSAPPDNPSLFTITPVPEPSTVALLGLAGGVALLRYLRKKKICLSN